MTYALDVNNATGRIRPDDVDEFRLAQLLLLLAEAQSRGDQLDLYRISVLDFIAANPFLVLGESERARTTMRMAGFGEHSLTYAAPGQRYATRRERLVHDLTMLDSYGLIRVTAGGGRRIFTTTEQGFRLSAEFTSIYADAYRASAQEMLPRVAKLSDSALQRQLGDWLRADPVLFDLLDVPELDARLMREPKND